MTIRQANKADMDILVTLIRNAFHEVAERFELTAENCPKSPAFYTIDRMKSDLAKGLRSYILEENDKACGCVSIEQAKPDVCYLMRLGVLPEHRKKGYGKALVNHIFEQAKKIGVKRVEIAIIAEDTKRRNWY